MNQGSTEAGFRVDEACKKTCEGMHGHETLMRGSRKD